MAELVDAGHLPFMQHQRLFAMPGVTDVFTMCYCCLVAIAGLVPIVEPEVLIDGTHSAAEFGQACERMIGATVAQLWRQGVQLEGCLLKPQMIIKVRGHTPHQPVCCLRVAHMC
jgi:fructose-bisphosphate aldolase class 1